MKNVTRGTIKKNNNKEVDAMEKNRERLSNELTDFIMTDEFMMRFIIDSVEQKIYNNREYSVSMVEDTLINDLDTGNTDSYLISFIIEEIDVFQIAYRIDRIHRDRFYKLAHQTKRY